MHFINYNKKYIIILTCLFLFGGLFHFSQAASDKNYFYDSIEVEIQINSDSTFNITEKQTYQLNGSFGFFYRDIELKKLDHISNIEIFDEKGERIDEEEYDLSHRLNNKHIQWNFPRRYFKDELKSWTIKYKVHGGLGFYDNYDELYWNAIFADRDVLVNYAQVIVHLPKEIEKEKIYQKLFIGEEGNDLEFLNFGIIDNRTVNFWGENIKPNEFMTIVVNWPKGLVKKPLINRNQIFNWLAILIAILIPLTTLIRSYRSWSKTGKDPKIDKTIIAQYEPPENLLPGIVGVLMEQGFNVKQITATIINLAVRGYIKIKEGEKKFLQGKEYILEKTKTWEDLMPYEKEVMKGIFTSFSINLKNTTLKQRLKQLLEQKLEVEEKRIVSSNDLRNKFYTHLPLIKKLIHQEAVKTGYLTGNIKKIRKKFEKPHLIPLILGFFGIFIGVFIAALVGLIGIWLIIISFGLIFSSIIGIIFSRFMPSLTEEGAEEKWKWLGFKEYLHTAERFRIGAETVETFSKFLPYAIIFGVEKQWASRFSDLEYKQPNWYAPVITHTSGNIGTSSFSGLTSSISSFSHSISSTLGSSPGSSGSSSGSSGGGGGGGGGGAG